MRTGRMGAAAGLLATALTAGCVDRRFIIESNVPNAQVYVDNKPVGAAPVDVSFDYYGYYDITLVHPNYAPLTKRMRVRPPWYAYPPIDFFAEVLWPFRIEDKRTYYLCMERALQVQSAPLIEKADLLRQRGWALPVPPPSSPSLPAVTPDGTLLPSPSPVPEGPLPIPTPPAGTIPVPDIGPQS